MLNQEPKLWYGIGILYDRYGSLEHAEEAFSQVMRMQPDFEKANEIYFRLGIIYKQQQKFQQSLEVCGQRFLDGLSLIPFCSVSSTSLPIRPGHSTKRTFGSRLAMSMNNKKMWVSRFSGSETLLTSTIVRERQECVQAGARPRPETRKGATTARMAASPAKQQLHQPRPSNRVPRAVCQFW